MCESNAFLPSFVLFKRQFVLFLYNKDSNLRGCVKNTLTPTFLIAQFIHFVWWFLYYRRHPENKGVSWARLG